MQYANKARDTLLNGYSKEEFERICRELWIYHAESSPKCHLRTLVNILLGYYMLTSGGDRRAAELLDLFTFKFKGEGPTCRMPLIFTSRASKQN